MFSVRDVSSTRLASEVAGPFWYAVLYGFAFPLGLGRAKGPVFSGENHIGGMIIAPKAAMANKRAVRGVSG